MHRYFVSYAFPGGFGNQEVTTTDPITRQSHVKEIERIMPGPGPVIILNFQLLEEIEG